LGQVVLALNVADVVGLPARFGCFLATSALLHAASASSACYLAVTLPHGHHCYVHALTTVHLCYFLRFPQVNKKTRTAAYQLIVDIAHELDEARPLTLNLGNSLNPADSDADLSSDDMDYGDDVKRGKGKSAAKPASGGLLDFVNAVMGGLVGSSPHMQSAAVLALARLSFEFAGQLESVVGRLLPAVLLLLRSQSREVIKAVLGFIKVGAGCRVWGFEVFSLVIQHLWLPVR
jgi:hypothetical protein